MPNFAATGDGLDIPPYLQRKPAVKPFVFTYSNLNCYEDVCPHQFYRRYLAKDLGPFVETEAIKEGNDIHAAFELRVGGGKPLPDRFRQWEHFARPLDNLPGTPKIKVEMKLGITAQGKSCDFFDANVFGRGKADVVVINGDRAAMIDWKGGGNSKYEKPFELEIHALMLRARYSNLTSIVGQYAWLKENRMSQTYDLSDFGGTWARVNNIVERIKDDVVAGEFKKRPGPLCGGAWGSCPVVDCEHRKGVK
jgi:hypothetical protein